MNTKKGERKTKKWRPRETEKEREREERGRQCVRLAMIQRPRSLHFRPLHPSRDKAEICLELDRFRSMGREEKGGKSTQEGKSVTDPKCSNAQAHRQGTLPPVGGQRLKRTSSIPRHCTSLAASQHKWPCLQPHPHRPIHPSHFARGQKTVAITPHSLCDYEY